MQNILKLFTRILTGLLERNDVNQIILLCNLLLKKLPVFISSGHIEVQERASSAYVLIQMLKEQFPSSDGNNVDVDNNLLVETDQSNESQDNQHENESETASIPIGAIEIAQEMAVLFAGDLNPVAPKAQRKVMIPDGLDLDEWINAPAAESSDSSDEEQTDLFVSNDNNDEPERYKVELTAEEMDQVCSRVRNCI